MDRAQQKRARYDRVMKDATEAYVAEHGSMPPCRCGCGQPVGMKYPQLVPAQYLTHHHGGDTTAARAAYAADRIPLAGFQAALRKLKEQRGCTWREMAEKSGLSYGHFRSLVHSKEQKMIERELATQILRRLSGLPTLPSTYQKRQVVASNRQDAAWRREWVETG